MDENGPLLRVIAVADDLLRLYRRMAEAGGVAEAALVEEALRTFARQRGWEPDAGFTTLAGSVPGAEARADEAAGGEVPAPGSLEIDVQLEGSADRQAGVDGSRLFLLARTGEPREVAKERFLIGRGRQCDLVIDDPRVSREHVAIVSSEGAFWIEDLGSSNGTWFAGARIERQRIADGDEYFVCSERIRCTLR